MVCHDICDQLKTILVRDIEGIRCPRVNYELYRYFECLTARTSEISIISDHFPEIPQDVRRLSVD